MPRYIKVYNNALPKEFCQRLIAKFEADPNVQPDPQPNYSTRHYLNISRQREWRMICAELLEHANNITEKYFKLPAKYQSSGPEEWIDDGYVIARYAPGDKCAFHADGQSAEPGRNGLRLATQLFYLNTVTKGGETSFPLQKVKVKPQMGKAIMFPPGITHPHEVLASKQVRYILQTWITDPDHIVVSNEEDL
jgi:hypothetical protein